MEIDRRFMSKVGMQIIPLRLYIQVALSFPDKMRFLSVCFGPCRSKRVLSQTKQGPILLAYNLESPPKIILFFLKLYINKRHDNKPERDVEGQAS